MLRHPSASQRLESLAYLTSVLSAYSPERPLPQPMSVFLPTICQLILDPNQGVRQQVLKLLNYIPAKEVRTEVGRILHWVVASMMQLSVDVSLFSLDVLQLLLVKAPQEVVSSAGGWTKMLNCFLKLLGWQQHASATQNGWSNIARDSRPGSQGKIMAKQLTTLASFLKAGILPPRRNADDQAARTCFPLTHFDQHRVSSRSNAFAELDLFGTQSNGDSELLEDREDRQRIFHDRFENTIIDRVEQTKREGGEVGRAGASLAKIIAEGMRDFENDLT